MVKRTKPTGKISQDRLSAQGIETIKIEFPKTKEEIEIYIAKLYTKELSKLGETIEGLELNETDDFDFNCTLNGEINYLELMEIANLQNSGYESAKERYVYDAFAKFILGQIRKKSLRYNGVTDKPIILLIYTTENRFYPTDQVLELLEYWLRKGEEHLYQIDVLCPLVGERATLRRVFPSTRKNWVGFSPAKYKHQGVAFGKLVKNPR